LPSIVIFAAIYNRRKPLNHCCCCVLAPLYGTCDIFFFHSGVTRTCRL